MGQAASRSACDRGDRRWIACALAALFLGLGEDARAQLDPWPEGDVRFYNVADSDFDPYIANPTLKEQAWMREHYARMQTYSPHFDSRLKWFDAAWAYKNSYAIKPKWSVFKDHPEWILRDAQGNMLYIPWGCSGGTCPQFAADFGNPLYRTWWIQGARELIARGYAGLWIDDVNFTWRVSDGNGNHVTPIDPRTGKPMTLADWRRYLAEFLEEVRARLPEAEIAHNIVWFAAPPSDPFAARGIDAADHLNFERGVNDSGLVGGRGTWGLETFLGYIDFVHDRGRSVILMDYGSTLGEREYGLAGWLLVSAGTDLMCSDQLAWTAPDTWWRGYELPLGRAQGPRSDWKGLLRRDFKHGMVLLNQPGMPSRTVALPEPLRDLEGNTVSAVTLDARQAAVLLRP